jgi:hypothetical protein
MVTGKNIVKAHNLRPEVQTKVQTDSKRTVPSNQSIIHSRLFQVGLKTTRGHNIRLTRIAKLLNHKAIKASVPNID